MDNSKDEKIAKEIAKMSDLIRKKYCTLKTDNVEEDITLERHFKSYRVLKQIVKNIVESSKDPIMTKTFFLGEDKEPKPKKKRPNALYNNSIQASTPVKSMLSQSKTVHFERSI